MNFAGSSSTGVETFEDLLWKCVNEGVRDAYERAQSNRHKDLTVAGQGLPVDEFVFFMAQQIYNVANRSTKQFLDEQQLSKVANTMASKNFLNLKRFLYAKFRMIDINGDNRVSWEDFIAYILDEKNTDTSERGQEDQMKYVVKKVLRCSHRKQTKIVGAADNQIVADLERRVLAKRKAAILAQKAVESGSLFLPWDESEEEKEFNSLCLNEPWQKLIYFTKWHRILALGCFSDCTILSRSDLKPIGAVPCFGSTAKCVVAFEDSSPLHLIVGYSDNVLRMYSIKERTRTRVDTSLEVGLHLDATPICMKGVPNCTQTFAVGDSTGCVRLFRSFPSTTSAEKSEIRRLQRNGAGCEWEFHKGHVTDMLFIPKGQLLSCSSDTTLQLHDLVKPEKEFHTVMHGHKRGVSHLDYSHAWQMAVSGGYEFYPYLWNVNAPQDKPTVLSDTANPHRGCLIGVKFIPETPLVVSCDSSGVVKTWDVRRMGCVQSITDHIASMAHTAEGHTVNCMLHIPHGNELITAGRQVVYFGEADQSDPNCCSDHIPIAIRYHAWSHCILTAHSRHVTLWDAERGHVLATFECKFQNLVESITAFAVSTRGRTYYVGTSNGSVFTYSMMNGTLIADYPNLHEKEVSSLSYFEASTSHLEFVMSTSLDGTMQILTDDVRLPRRFKLPGSSMSSCIHIDAQDLSVISTSDGKLITVELHSCLSRGPIGREQYCAEGSGIEIVATCTIGSTPYFAITDSDGWLRVMSAKQLSRVSMFRCPSVDHDPKIQPFFSCIDCYSTGISTFLCCGDDRGRIWVFNMTALTVYNQHLQALRFNTSNSHFEHNLEVSGGLLPKASESTPLKTIRESCESRGLQAESHALVPTYSWQGHTQSIVDIHGIGVLRIILTLSSDRCAHVYKEDGQRLANICQGRGLRNVRWLTPLNPEGVPPPYVFPLRPDMMKTSEGAIHRITLFLRKLRRCAAERRNRLVSTLYSGKLIGKSFPERTEEASSSEETVLPHESAPDSPLAMSQHDTPITVHSTPESEETRTYMRKAKVDLKVRVTKEENPYNGVSRTFQRTHNSAVVGMPLKDTVVTEVSRASPTNFTSIASSVIVKKPLETFESTENRIGKHVGHIVTLKSEKKGLPIECSPRIVIPTLDLRFKQQEAAERNARMEETLLRKLRHSCATDAKAQMTKILYQREERKKKEEADARRAVLERIPKPPPAVLASRTHLVPSQRPNSARPRVGGGVMTPRPPALREMGYGRQTPRPMQSSWVIQTD